MIYGTVRVYLAAGTVYGGTGVVWQKPTHGIPILNSSCCQAAATAAVVTATAVAVAVAAAAIVTAAAAAVAATVTAVLRALVCSLSVVSVQSQH